MNRIFPQQGALGVASGPKKRDHLTRATPWGRQVVASCTRGAALLRWRPNQSLRRRRGRRQLDPSRRGEERRRVPTVLLSSATDGGLPLVLARFVRGLRHQGSGCPRRLRTAATAQVSPRAGRLPSGRGPNADRPFDEPATSTARRVAAATWMMSSTTVASRAYAVVPAMNRIFPQQGALGVDQVELGQSRSSTAPSVAPRRGFRARAARSHPLVSSAGAASFGLRWSRCPCRSLRTKSWPRRCSSRSSSLSLICRASLDERRALASAKTASAAAHGARLGRSMQGTPVRGTSNVRRWNPVVTAIAGLPPFPRHRTRTPRECPEGSAPEGDRPTVFGTVSRLGWPPERRGYALAWLLSPRNEHWRDASAGKKAHE